MKETIDYKNRKISEGASVLEAMRYMDDIDRKLLIIAENNKFIGLVSVGDLQRAIIADIPLETKVTAIIRDNIRVASPENSFEEIKELMIKYRMELLPVIGNDHQISKIYFWEDIFSESKPSPKNLFDLPIIIMAGGFGTRLKPLTNVLPKPLIPFGETTILEQIFKRFADHGSNRFHISVNYKAELIEFYLKDQKLPYQIDYFKEDKPMGTAGSLHLLKDSINETFFVSNCDIIVEQDYSEILAYHKENNNEITIVAALKHYSIPYGTIETTENGELVSLSEKPELTFKINSGMYILEPHLLNEIPEDDFYHITHLIDSIRKRNGKVGVFPVSEKSWIDIGQWDEYLKNNVDV